MRTGAIRFTKKDKIIKFCYVTRHHLDLVSLIQAKSGAITCLISVLLERPKTTMQLYNNLENVAALIALR
jgi:hypothetical protein